MSKNIISFWRGFINELFKKKKKYTYIFDERLLYERRRVRSYIQHTHIYITMRIWA